MFVMKRPEGESKGIVVITRQEVPLVLDDLRPVRRVVAALREQYLVAVAETWSPKPVSSPSWVDFHFSRTKSLAASGPVRVLPFDESSFIPAYFRERGGDGQWDIVSVTRASEQARVQDLLSSLRTLKDRRPQARAIVFCRAASALESPGTLQRLLEMYHRDFPASDRDDIALVVLHPQSLPRPLPSKDMAWVYGACRVYVSFDPSEQTQLRVNEALLSGLHVVLHRRADGGAELAQAESLHQLSDIDAVVREMERLLEAPARPRVETSTLSRSSCETHTVPRLLDALGKLYADLGLPFRGEVDTEHLAAKLGSTPRSLIPEFGGQAFGHELHSPAEMLERIKQLVMQASGSQPLSPFGLLQAELDCRRRAGQERARSIIGQARRVIRRATP